MTQVIQSVSGLSMMHFRDAVGILFGPDVVRHGLARLDADTRFQIETMNAVGWIPIEMLGQSVDAWADAAGVTPEELTVRGVQHSTRMSFASVWRVLLRFTTDSALIARAPLLYARVRNTGHLTVDLRASNDARLTLTQWRNGTDRQLLSLAVAFETILELTGRSYARCRFKRTSDGGVFQLTWGDPTVPERAFTVRDRRLSTMPPPNDSSR